MNYNIFSKLIIKTPIFSSEYKQNLLQEAKDFSCLELLKIVQFVYNEEEKNYINDKNIKFDDYIEPIIKTKKQISNIKKSWIYLNRLLKLLQKNIKPWIKLNYLEKLTKEFLQSNTLKGSFKWVDSYKYNISVSINNKIIHHIPNNYILKSWDLVTIDTWIDYKGWITDSAFCMIVWWFETNLFARKMLYILKKWIDEHITKLKPWYNMYNFSANFYNFIFSQSLHIIKNSSWHWVGIKLHEEPKIYNWPCEYMKNIILKPGMILAIEPLITWKTSFTLSHKKNIWFTHLWDIWCYFEYTILITEIWYEILSWPKDMVIPELKIEYETKNIFIWDKNYILEIADTNNKQTYWLMFRNELQENKWMLFQFHTSGYKTFTMNHTFIKLDIIGLNKNFEVVYLKQNIKNYFDEEYEECIHIDKKVMFVIELKSWEILKNSIKIKDIIKYL